MEKKTKNYKVQRHIVGSDYDAICKAIEVWIEQSNIMIPAALNGHIYQAVRIEANRHNVRYPNREVVVEPNDGGAIRVTDKGSGVEVLRVTFDTIYPSKMNLQN